MKEEFSKIFARVLVETAAAARNVFDPPARLIASIAQNMPARL